MSKPGTKSSLSDRPKGRSPSYPAINLEKAISRAREIWDKEKQHPTPLDAVVEHWSYKSINGPASLALAALKKFGLITVQGERGQRRARLTDLAVQILNHPDEKTRQKGISEAALTPPIHAELWKTYGAKLPSIQTLKWDLTRERGFTETGADEFIPEYQHTIAFAKLVESDSSETQDEDLEDDRGWETTDDEELSSERRKKDARGFKKGVRAIDIPLPGGASVVIEGQFPLSEREWTQFLAVLTVMKLGLVEEQEDEETI